MATPKPFTVLTCAQRSPEWYAARCGVFTASRAYDAFRRTAKGDYRAERRDYQIELVLERTTGKVAPTFQSRDMTNGLDRQDRAIRVYENIHGELTRAVGFVLDNAIPIGCSPDAVIGNWEGLVEAKCPKAATHLATLTLVRAHDEALSRGEILSARAGCVPPEYLAQIRHALYCTGASWCDYLSYHPDFPAALQAVTIRVTPEDVDLHHYQNEVRLFLDEVDAQCELIAGWAA